MGARTGKQTARRSRRRWLQLAAAALAPLLLAGCGAQDLYQPPDAPYGVVGRLGLPANVQGVSVLGDVAYVAGGEAGLLIVDLSDPTAPVLLEMLDTVKFAESVKVASTAATGEVIDIAFVVEGTEGITTYNVTDPQNAYSFEQGTTAVDGNGLFIELPDDPGEPYIVYLAESWKGLRIFEADASVPGLLDYNGVFASTRGYAKSVAVDDGFAYVADDELGLAVLDVRTRQLGAVEVVSACDTPGYAYGVAKQGGNIFIADQHGGLVVMELRQEGDPPLPVPYEIGHLELPGKCRDIVVRDGVAFIAAQDAGVHFVDVSVPSAPRLLGTVISSYANGVALSNAGLVLVSDRDEGLLVLAGPGPFRDVIAPARVTELAATGIDSTSVSLAWEAPGNDGLTGTAAAYDVRFALSSIDTIDDWEAATTTGGEPEPGPRGTAESLLVTGLTPGTTYYFGLRTGDAAGNWSGISNVAVATTPSGNVAPSLTGGSVAPEAGTGATGFTFEVTYQDGDGDAPAVAQVVVSGTSYEMTAVDDTYESGARFRYQTALPVGSHDYSFTFSDGHHASIHTRVRSGPWVGRELFEMGSPADEPGRDSDETLHSVVLTREVEIADHEVTQAEYTALMGTNPSRFTGDALPVESVSWFDAVAYCNARSQAEGHAKAYTIDGDQVTWNAGADGYRLPTEAEWEEACRAGTSTAFAGGDLTEEACGLDPVLDAAGWYCGNAGATTHAGRGKQPNAGGLYDMHGNVWEWCWDWYVADLGTGVAVDPSGPPGGSQRVIRGGSWYYFARDCRSASRAPYWPSSKDDIVGFRVARTVR